MKSLAESAKMLSLKELEAIANELLASESRFRRIFDSTMIGMAVVNIPGEVLEANVLYSELVGVAPEELLGMNFQRFTEPDDIAAEQRLMKELFAGNMRSFQFEKRYRTKTNLTRWVELWVTALPNAQGHLDRAICMIVDTTDQKHANKAVLDLNRDLKVSTQLLRDMAAQNDEIRESERTHIAHEVHDELGQVMTALRMKLSVIELRYGPRIPDLANEMHDIKMLVDKAIRGVRNVVGSLRPASLDLGLIPAIDWLCTEFTKQTSIECVFNWGKQKIELDDKRAVVVFRIIQESLNNVSRHANSSRVDVNLKVEGDLLQVAVRDNGDGFDKAVTRKKKTFGLLGMKERAIALGGRLDVTSNIGEGTLVTLTINGTASAKGSEQ
jgi:PAS domain S-box-containing protein